MRVVLVAALLGGLGVVAAPSMVSTQAAGGAGETEVRIVARRVAGERVEFALQERGASGAWGERLLPARRFFPPGTEPGRWLSSSPLVVAARDPDGMLLAGTETELRITARRVSGGRVEFALQERGASGVWGERLLPARRFLPVSTPLGRWFSSSSLTVPVEDRPVPVSSPVTAPVEDRPVTVEELPGQASVVAVGGEGSLSVRWSASAGSSPILRWELGWSFPGGGYTESYDGATTEVFWDSDGSTRAELHWLLAGRHTVRVRACNTHGCGLWGSDTATVRSAAVPVRRRLPGQASVVAVGGEGSLSVRWSASAGSSPILRWELQWDYPLGGLSTNYDGATTEVFWDSERAGPFHRTGLLRAGLHIVRVRACNAHGCGLWGLDIQSVLPVGGLTPATLRLRAWGDEIVGQHEAAHPWLRVAWDHIRDNTFHSSEYLQGVEISCNLIESYYEVLGDSFCLAMRMSLSSHHVGILVHELAHVYDRTPGLASNKTAWGAVQLYFWMTYGDCLPSSTTTSWIGHPTAEILADTVLYVFDPSSYLGYYQPGVLSEGCLDGTEPTPEAVEVVRAGLEGRVPQWYTENFSNGAELWEAIQPLMFINNTFGEILLANLWDEFGGLCSKGSTDLGSLWGPDQHIPAAGANPFRDGGCGS